MSDKNKPISIPIPKKSNLDDKLQNEKLAVQYGETTIIVGANGSGKTRLAVHIEEYLGEKAHRIAAHRALNLNPSVDKIPEQQAKKYLKEGHYEYWANKKEHRWSGKAATVLLNDFDQLLQYLFAQQNNIAVAEHQRRKNGEYIPDNEIDTKLDRLKEAWETLLPHRKLHITADDIQVSLINELDNKYSASEMSDGERAIFYILGQVLAADENSVLIFDEPELHIHKAIISNLWDKLEELRPDCVFFIITHDIEFASTRTAKKAKKYVIRDYFPDPAWNISAIPDSSFDEQTITLILGSRKPILFVEGSSSSLDIEIYRNCYPEWIVIPRGSCKDVIQAVSSLDKLNNDMPLLNIKCAGIVDRDTREQSDIELLNRSNIKVLPISEIENLFSLSSIAEEILKIEGFTGDELDKKLSIFKNKLVESIKDDLAEDKLEQFAIKRVQRKIDAYLKRIDLSKSTSSADMKYKLISLVDNLIKEKIENWISELKRDLQDYLSNNDIDKLLEIYENKGLLSKSASLLKNTTQRSFEEWLMRQLKNQDSPLLQAIKKILPSLPE